MWACEPGWGEEEEEESETREVMEGRQKVPEELF